MPPTLSEIAEENGWTFTQKGVKGAPDYIFTKGKVTVRYSRKGSGSLIVKWGDFTAPWQMAFEHEGRKVYSHEMTREGYVGVLLPSVTEDEVLNRIEKSLSVQVAHIQRNLTEATDRLTAFRCQARWPSPDAPICSACNDTHRMKTRPEWACTSCPTPCQKCRQGGNGPFCEKTPCACTCHATQHQYAGRRSAGPTGGQRQALCMYGPEPASASLEETIRDQQARYGDAIVTLRKVEAYVRDWREGDNAFRALGHITTLVSVPPSPSATPACAECGCTKTWRAMNEQWVVVTRCSACAAPTPPNPSPTAGKSTDGL
jgi:hypothetical protein